MLYVLTEFLKSSYNGSLGITIKPEARPLCYYRTFYNTNSKQELHIFRRSVTVHHFMTLN
jgi:hypothetical protein